MWTTLRFVSISEWKMQKKFKNRLWKSRACLPLMSNNTPGQQWYTTGYITLVKRSRLQSRTSTTYNALSNQTTTIHIENKTEELFSSTKFYF
jgi:hypothetical protein